MYPYLFTKNGERLPHSSMHARNLAMKPKGFACVLCYYFGSLSQSNDSFLTLSVHLVLYLFVLTLHAYHSFSYLSQFQSTTWQPHF